MRQYFEGGGEAGAYRERRQLLSKEGVAKPFAPSCRTDDVQLHPRAHAKKLGEAALGMYREALSLVVCPLDARLSVHSSPESQAVECSSDVKQRTCEEDSQR